MYDTFSIGRNGRSPLSKSLFFSLFSGGFLRLALLLNIMWLFLRLFVCVTVANVTQYCFVWRGVNAFSFLVSTER